MTVIPGTYNLRIPQRADLRVRIVLPFDCTHKTVAAEVWNEKRTRLILFFDVEWEDRAAGILWLKAPWSRTKNVTTKGHWDLVVADDITGSRDFYLEGVTEFDPGFTEIAEVV